MRAKIDAGTDAWMTQVADAGPRFWVHCWYCVCSALVDERRLRTPMHFDIPQPCSWTPYINSRETALKRDNEAGCSIPHWKRWSFQTIFMGFQGEPCVDGCTVLYCLCTVTSLSSSCWSVHSCISFCAAVLSSLSFCWWTNGSISQHCYHMRPYMLMVQSS